jgi:hypothetical protein
MTMKLTMTVTKSIRQVIVRQKWLTAGLAIATMLLVFTGTSGSPASASSSARDHGAASALPPIKHVWFIILENKSYDATFTGLNNNTYLWKLWRRVRPPKSTRRMTARPTRT